jgi:hypothetical protein
MMIDIFGSEEILSPAAAGSGYIRIPTPPSSATGGLKRG